MRYRGLIDDILFLKEKTILETKMKDLNDNLNTFESNDDKELELTKEKFNSAVYAHKKLLFGNLDEQKEVVNTLFSKITAKNRQLTFEPYEWFIPIKEGYPSLYSKYLELEPFKKGFNKEQNDAFASLRSRWSNILKLARTYFEKNS